MARAADTKRDERGEPGAEQRVSATPQAARFGASPDAELLRLLVGSVTDYAIFVLDPEGRVASWNPGAERIKGYTADEIIGSHFSRFYEPEEVAAGKPPYELEVAAAVGRFEDEGWRLRKDGTRLWANVVITALRDETGRLRGFAKVTRDLSERIRSEERARALAAEQAVRAERELMLANAEAASRTKDEFLAMLSHELRNPLAPIVTALELMKLRAPTAVRREREVIERQVSHLTRLVEDLLDVSRITQGKVSLRQDRVRLEAAIARAVELAEPLIVERRQHLELDVDPALHVDGDIDRLAQIVTNLLTNAAKYTPPGGRIVVHASRDGSTAVITVTDDGEGIGAELLPRVFDLFTQSSQHLDRGRGGLGLGLAIVRGLVDVHGGTVAASSEGAGRGSTFTVRLPTSASSKLPATASREPAVNGAAVAHRILVVDDNEDSALLLQDFLTELGHDVAVAPDGPRALALAPSFAPQIALLDIGLPAMDGYELARHLHAIPGLEGLMLVAVTGYGRDGDRERARDAGFHAHLVKPLDLVQLRQLLKPPAPGGSDDSKL